MRRIMWHAFPLLCSAGFAGLMVSAGIHAETGRAETGRTETGRTETGRTETAEPVAGLAADGSALVAACDAARRDDTGSNGGFCNGFLLGYLQASPQVVFDEEVPSAYMERVLRTRAPDHPQTHSLKSASYCLEGESALVDIRGHVAAFDARTAANITPANVVAQVLQQHYRCPR